MKPPPSQPVEPPLPHSTSSEEAVLAALMVDDGAMSRVAPIVAERDFWGVRSQYIFAACQRLWERREPLNEITVAHELSVKGHLEEAGGLGYLSRIIGALPTPIGVEHWAGIVAEHAVRRRLIAASGHITAQAFALGRPLGDVLAEAQAALLALATASRSDVADLHTELDAMAVDAIQRLTLPGSSGELRWGVPELDAMLPGIVPGALYTVAGATGSGKTALLIQVAIAAVRDGLSVLHASMEMRRDQIWRDRLLMQALAGARIPSPGTTVTPLASAAYESAIDAARQTVAGWTGRWRVIDRGGLTIQRLRAECERLDPLPDIVLVDYTQLMGGSAGDRRTRAEQVGEVSRGLKELAMTLGRPVVAAAQLNRATGMHPGLANLRESGTIEQDSDVVIFLVECDGSCGWQQHVEAPGMWLNIAKHRQGATGWARTAFDAARGHWGGA